MTVIFLTQHPPHAEAPQESDDQVPSSGPEAGGPGTANTASPPGWDALVAMARLLGRQAAEEDMRTREG